MRLILGPYSPKIVIRIQIILLNVQYLVKVIIFIFNISIFLWGYVYTYKPVSQHHF